MGKIYSLIGTSGSGKTTIAHEIKKRGLADIIVSSTTRDKRDYETDGVDYNFIDINDVKLDNSDGRFVEMDVVYGNVYGIELNEIAKKTKYGNAVIPITYKGHKQLQELYGEENVKSIFIHMESIELLEFVLRLRGERDIEQRLNQAWEFNKYKDKCDISVENIYGNIAHATDLIEKFIKKTSLEYPVIAVDFDGTIAEDDFPVAKRIKKDVGIVLSHFRKMGGQVIVWTCRTGEALQDAKEFLVKHNIEYDTINANVESMKRTYGNDPRKVGADIYIDDKSIFMKEVDWHNIGVELGVINNFFKSEA